MDSSITIDNIQEAHSRIFGLIHQTPILRSSSLNGLAGADLFFKCENVQKTGSFKIRGASNALFMLNELEAKNGVATHSSGNFAAALSSSAKWLGMPSYLVMPENTTLVKVNAVRSYGGDVIFCEPTLEAREQELERIVGETGATFIHPYNNDCVIAGQGTAALELCQAVPDIDILVAPVGGGGLLAGSSIAAKIISSNISIVAAEPKGADDAYRSLEKGEIIPSVEPKTLCDGLLTSLGDKTFPIIQKNVDAIIRVKDETTIEALRLIMERMKQVVEPSAAITLGAILTDPERFKGKRVGLILSGGNINLDQLPWL